MAIFKKSLLAVALCVFAAPAPALQSLDDDSLAAATGQDGLTVTLPFFSNPINIALHDTDGFAAGAGFGGMTAAGALLQEGFSLSGTGLTLLADVGSSSPTTAMLQLRFYNPAAVTVNLGALKIANSQRDDATPGTGLSNITPAIVNLGSLTLAATSAASPLMNLQLGAEGQGSMMRLDTSLTGGINLTGFSINDVGGGSGSLTASSITLTDRAGSNLTANVAVDVTSAGLRVQLNQLGTAAGGVDQKITGLKLGAGVALGDVEMIGLNMNGAVLTIAGH